MRLNRSFLAKVTTILAVGLGIGLGLCGIGLATSDGGNRQGLMASTGTGVLVLGTLTFWLSALGLVLTLITVGVASVVGLFTGGGQASDDEDEASLSIFRPDIRADTEREDPHD